MEHTITILPDGSLRFIWTDEFAELVTLGPSEIVRASHVEPVGTEWQADMGPSNGPILRGFTRRQDAIDAEVQWLKQNRGL
jgi:hypothetical protein